MKASIAAILIALAGAWPMWTGAPVDGDLGAGWGPPATVEGTVRDAQSGALLQGAQVTVVGGRIGTLTDVQGRFLLSLPTRTAGEEVTLRVELIGYSAETRVIELADQGTTVDFALQKSALSLDEIVVVGTAEQARKAVIGNSISTVTVQDGVPSAAVPAGVAGRYRHRSGPWNTESYAVIEESGFRSVDVHPLSTFSIDVDRASYANVRRFLQSGQRPPVDAVRIEEMINYFPYEWAEVRGEHPFRVTTEVWQAPWNTRHRLVRVGLRARSVDLEDIPPSNLVFLLDVSGSMGSPDKLPLLKQAFRLLVEQLREEDRVSIVVYAGAAGLVLPSTPGSDRGEILGALERLRAGGSTAGGAGLQLAYSIARENYIDGGNNRIILATDGDFNVGPSSDGEMVRLIERERESGTFLTVLGFGTGNLKDSKMEQIADHGNGNFAYVDNLFEARKVLVEEMGGTLLTLAKDVKLQIEFNPARVASYRLIGYENRLLADEDFNDDTKDAGELGAGHTVTALYEVVPPDVATRAVDPLRYQPESRRPVEDARLDDTGELMYVKIRYKDPDGATSKLLDHVVMDETARPSTDFRFAAAVAGFGMLLRDSEHAGDLSLHQVIEMAKGALGPDRRGYRQEFVRLAELALEKELIPERSTETDLPFDPGVLR